jgi:hypothetical protein
MGSIRGKNQRSKISCYCPFKESGSIRKQENSVTIESRIVEKIDMARRLRSMKGDEFD